MKRNMNAWWISGWSYMGRTILTRMTPERQQKLQKPGDAFTVEQEDRYIRYVRSSWVTSSSKIPIIDIHRRFKKGTAHL